MSAGLRPGDVIKWEWRDHSTGVAIGGGTGLVLPNGEIMQRTPYELTVKHIYEINPERFWVIGNLFTTAELKTAYKQP